jgi:hypothetical protein
MSWNLKGSSVEATDEQLDKLVQVFGGHPGGPRA